MRSPSTASQDSASKILVLSVRPSRSPFVYHARCFRNSRSAFFLIGLEGDRGPGMLEAHLESLLHRGALRRWETGERSPRFPEDPGIPVGPPCDHDAVAPGLRPHPGGVLTDADVAIPDDWDVQGFRHGPNLTPTGMPCVHVGPRAWVEREHLGTGVLTGEADADRVPGLFVEATANLGGRGERRSLRHGPNDVPDQPEVSEAPRPAVPSNHLLDRAPEVDVHEIGSVDLGNQGRGVRHHDRIRAEDLNADGALDLIEPQVAMTPLAVSDDPVGAHELANDHVRAESAADPSERRLAHTRLRREEERIGGRNSGTQATS